MDIQQFQQHLKSADETSTYRRLMEVSYEGLTDDGDDPTAQGTGGWWPWKSGEDPLV